MKIDTSKWKEFPLKSLFLIKRGDRIVKDVDYYDAKDDVNVYPVITTTMTDNGVDGFYSKYNCDGNCLISAGEASGMFTTYQKGRCWALDTVRIYTPIGFEINEIIALFLATILTKEMYKFSYGRKAKPDNMYSLSIKLPATASGDPDWDFMEKYMGGLHSKPLTTSNKPSNTPLDTSKWATYKLTDICSVTYGNKMDANSMTDFSPSVNFVGRSADNNGVKTKVDCVLNEEGVQIIPNKAGCVTVALGGSLGASFLQKEKFYTSQNVAVLTFPEFVSDAAKLFVCTVIQKECSFKFFPFGRELNSHIKKDFTLKLPTTPFGDPDWNFMENYIKSLPYGDKV